MNPQGQIVTKTRRVHANHLTPVTFTGSENHLITLNDAIRLTKNFRRTVPDGSILGGFFGQQIFTKLLNQQTCVGIRIYYSSKDDGVPTFVLVGVNANNNDISEGFLGAHPIMSTSPLDRQLSDLGLPVQSDANASTVISQTHSGQENHLTTLAEAGRLTRKYRDSARGRVYKGGFFGKNIFNKILSQPGCVGIHLYYAQHDDGRPTFVLAGADAMGHHFAKWPFGDDLFQCPPWCAPTNPLNQ